MKKEIKLVENLKYNQFDNVANPDYGWSLCSEGVRQWFDVPKNVHKIVVVFTNRNAARSYNIKIPIGRFISFDHLLVKHGHHFELVFVDEGLVNFVDDFIQRNGKTYISVEY